MMNTMQYLGPILIALIGLAVIWLMLRKRYEFIVRIGERDVRLLRGKVAPAVLSEVRELCDREGLTRGEIRGVRHNRRVALQFSRQIPGPNQQQIRNLWNLR